MNQTQTIWALYVFFLILLGLISFYLWQHKDNFTQTMNALSTKIRPAATELPSITSTTRRMIEHNILEEKTIAVNADNIKDAYDYYIKVKGAK
jgi:hypothetical protein